jgi:hypothetical protein
MTDQDASALSRPRITLVEGASDTGAGTLANMVGAAAVAAALPADQEKLRLARYAHNLANLQFIIAQRGDVLANMNDIKSLELMNRLSDQIYSMGPSYSPDVGEALKAPFDLTGNATQIAELRQMIVEVGEAVRKLGEPRLKPDGITITTTAPALSVPA